MGLFSSYNMAVQRDELAQRAATLFFFCRNKKKDIIMIIISCHEQTTHLLGRLQKQEPLETR